ncbi:MAG: type VI secretion system lipoprotein TssJ [Rhizobiaceae bacterium]
MRRRVVLASLASLVFNTGALFGPKASKVTVNLVGGAGMNPGPNGGDRPVMVMIYRLRSTGMFEQADYFALEGNASGTLGGDLLGMDSVAVAPGRRASQQITVEPEAAALGFVAFVREPASRRWKSTLAMSPGSQLTITVGLGGAGISLSRRKNSMFSSQSDR